MLKKELNSLYVSVPKFYDKLFRSVEGLKSITEAILDKCKKEENSLYCEEIDWRG